MMRMGALVLTLIMAAYADASTTRRAAKVYEAALDRPDEALKLIFPGSDGFTAQSLTWRRHGPQKPEARQEALSLIVFHMRDKLDPVYETEDTPIVTYAVRGGSVLGGYFRWKRGLMEVFTAITSEGAIHDVYVQRMDGGYKALFRSAAYRAQFRRFGFREALDDAALSPPVPGEASFPNVDMLLAHQRVVRAVRWALLTQKALVRGEWQDLRKVAAF